MDVGSFHKVREELIVKTTAEIKRAKDTEKALKFSETLVQREIHLARLQTDVQLNRLETKAQINLKSVVGNEIKHIHEIVAQFNDVIDRLNSTSMTFPNQIDGASDLSNDLNMVEQLSNKLERKKVKFLTNIELDTTFKNADNFGDITLVKVLPVVELHAKPTTQQSRQDRVSEGADIIDDTNVIGNQERIRSKDGTSYSSINTENMTNGGLLITHDNRTSVFENTKENPFTVLRALNEKQKAESALIKPRDTLEKHHSTRSPRRNINLLPSSCHEESKDTWDRHKHRTESVNAKHDTDRAEADSTNCADSRLQRGDKSTIWRRSRSMSPKSVRSVYNGNSIDEQDCNTSTVQRENRPVRGYTASYNNEGKSRGKLIVKTQNSFVDNNKGSNVVDTCNINRGRNELRKCNSDNKEVSYKPNSNAFKTHINGSVQTAKTADNLNLGNMDGKVEHFKTPGCVDNFEEKDSKCTGNVPRHQTTKYPQTDLDVEFEKMRRKHMLQLKRLRNRSINTICPVRYTCNIAEQSVGEDKGTVGMNTSVNKEKYEEFSEHSLDKQGNETKTNHMYPLLRSTPSDTDNFVSHFCTLSRRKQKNQVMNCDKNSTDNKVFSSSYNRNGERDQEIVTHKEPYTGCVVDKRNENGLSNGAKENANFTRIENDRTNKLPIYNGGNEAVDKSNCNEIEMNTRDRAGHSTLQRHEGSTRNRLPSFKEMLFISK